MILAKYVFFFLPASRDGNWKMFLVKIVYHRRLLRVEQLARTLGLCPATSILEPAPRVAKRKTKRKESKRATAESMSGGTMQRTFIPTEKRDAPTLEGFLRLPWCVNPNDVWTRREAWPGGLACAFAAVLFPSSLPPLISDPSDPFPPIPCSRE